VIPCIASLKLKAYIFKCGPHSVPANDTISAVNSESIQFCFIAVVCTLARNNPAIKPHLYICVRAGIACKIVAAFILIYCNKCLIAHKTMALFTML